MVIGFLTCINVRDVKCRMLILLNVDIYPCLKTVNVLDRVKNILNLLKHLSDLQKCARCRRAETVKYKNLAI